MARKAEISRKTTETRIGVAVDLDGEGRYDVKTGIGFLDHMLEQLSRHSLIDITRPGGGRHPYRPPPHDRGCRHRARARRSARRSATARASPATPPSTCRWTRSARAPPWMFPAGRSSSGRWSSRARRSASSTPSCSASSSRRWRRMPGITLHVVNLYGENSHHVAETCFKAVARAFRTAFAIDPRNAEAVPSTKGTLTGVRGRMNALSPVHAPPDEPARRSASSSSRTASPGRLSSCRCSGSSGTGFGWRSSRYIVFVLVVAWIGRLAGEDAATLVAILGTLLFALEANNIRRLSLERRGWEEIGDELRAAISTRRRCASSTDGPATRPAPASTGAQAMLPRRLFAASARARRATSRSSASSRSRSVSGA